MSSVMKINNVTIKKPTEFGVERYKLTKSGRVASGDMVMDIIAKKRKFTFRYAVLSGTALDIIRNVVDGNLAFFSFYYEENNVGYTVTVYPGALKYTKAREGNVWYWKDVSFDLIER